MKYAKIKSEWEIEIAPQNNEEKGIINYNQNVEMMLEDGYLPLEETQIPTTNRWYEIRYRQENNKIVQYIYWQESEEKYRERILKETKEAKSKENDEKAEFARENQYFELTLQDKVCTFQTTRKTQQDLLTAKDFVEMTGEAYQWFTDNNQEIYLSMEEILTISALFMQKANVYPVWSGYKTQINEAETVEEVEAIEIDYNTVRSN